MSEEIVRSLKRFDFFRNLPDEAIQDLVDHVETVELKQDEVLFNKGDVGEAVYILQDGWVKIVNVDQDGSEVVLNQVGPGAVFGEMALIDNEPRSAGVIALHDTQLLKLSREEFLDVLMKQPLVGLEISRSLIQRLRFATTYIENAIEWSKQIAAGDYDFVEQQAESATSAVTGPSQSDQERARRFLGTFFSMVKDIREREEELKEQLVQLKVVIDQQQRKEDVEELVSSEFFQKLKESKDTVRKKGGETGE